MSDRLPSGQYYIRNSATGAFAYRNLLEDRSAHPKAVFSPHDGDVELWELQALPNGRYKLKTRGAPTGVINDLLYAFIIEQEGSEEWIVTTRQHSQDGRLQYTIETASESAGWVSSDEEKSQIAVRPLISTLSMPPQFPPHQLWSIQPLGE